MDQDNSKGQDKRNWRERLGIGAQGAKDLPKISDDFRKEPASEATRPSVSVRPVAGARPAPRVAAPAVKPAPMAPRANPKAIAPAPISPDKLAERLRSQREASTKLAEQRVQVAKQRAESQTTPPTAAKPPVPPVPGAPKPKFTFAEENTNGAPAPQAAVRQTQPPAPQPQLSPARPPLGGAAVGAPPAFQPRPQQQPPYPSQPQYQQPPQQAPIGYQPQYSQQPVPPYRPIDPNSGFAPPPGYMPQQRGFTTPPGQFIPPQGAPRLNMPPPRGGPGLNSNYLPQQDYGAAQQPGFNAIPPRVARPQMRAPLPQQDDGGYEEEYDDQASSLGSRRPSTNDYQQAYREAEYGYEDEAPPSRAPWILASLLLLALAVAGVGVWLYLSSVKPLMTGNATTEQVPAVAAPETPAKVQAEPATGEATTRGLDAPSKKQIYDRIVGDQEVLGGELAPAVETPAAIPEPVIETAPAVPAAVEPAGSGGEEAAPLPIPPPPGGANDQQGSLAPDSSKQSSENISPAAGESQAAVAAPAGVEPAESAAPKVNETSSAPTPVEDAPVPGELKRLAAAPVAEEKIEDVAPEPIVKKKAVAKPKVDEEKKVATRSLGSEPVVLVPPAKKPASTSRKSKEQNVALEQSTAATSDSGGLYGNTDLTTANTDAAPVVPAAPAKKKKTLADLFRGESATSEPEQADVAATPEPEPVVPAKPVAKKPQASAPEQQASLGGFSVQLASFRSRNEASAEFSRLKAKHSATLGRFSPIISEAQVGGSTRYRLGVGGMTSQAQANAVCSSLFAGGERDCLVKRQ
jgi:cell division protein FtsN